MTACGGSKGAGTQKSEKGDGMTYAVEAGDVYKRQKYGCNNSVKDRTCSSYPSDSICDDCINNTACSHVNNYFKRHWKIDVYKRQEQ